MNTLPRRERKKQETRRRLLGVALRLFKEDGFDATTVEQIAEAADVAKGTFFNYFETKDAILPALVEWRLQQLEEALTPEQGAPTGPVARIKVGLCRVAEDPLLDPELVQQVFAAIVQQSRPHPPHPGRALISLLASLVREAQDAGEIRADIDAVYLSGLIRAMFFQHMMVWYHSPESAPCADRINEAVDLLLDGIGGPQWRRTA